MTTRASVGSLEYLRVPVTATKDGSSFDPTSDQVEIGLGTAGVLPTTFVTAAWETGGPPYVARITIGPGGDASPTAATYDVWIRITDDPEIPAFIADQLIVYDRQTSLVSVERFADSSGQDLDPEDAKANEALRAASAFIRAYTGQQFDAVADDEVELRGNWTDRLWLPQRPVTDLAAASLRYQKQFTFTDLDVASLTFDRRGLVLRPGSYWGGNGGVVQVTYDHGYAEIPEDIQAVCLSVASRGYQNPYGVQSETIGSYSVTYGTGAVGQVAGLTAWEKARLDNYRSQEQW